MRRAYVRMPASCNSRSPRRRPAYGRGERSGLCLSRARLEGNTIGAGQSSMVEQVSPWVPGAPNWPDKWLHRLDEQWLHVSGGQRMLVGVHDVRIEIATLGDPDAQALGVPVHEFTKQITSDGSAALDDPLRDDVHRSPHAAAACLRSRARPMRSTRTMPMPCSPPPICRRDRELRGGREPRSGERAADRAIAEDVPCQRGARVAHAAFHHLLELHR